MCRPQTTLPICTGRGEAYWAHCDEVLNDQYSLNPLGSEQSAVLTNTHEMALFRAEDERYELDTMIGLTTMAIQQIEPLAEELASLSRTEKQRFEVFDKIGLLPMRAIHRIYGEHGNEMVDQLYDAPAATIPVVLARLKQKDMEYRMVRHHQNRLWKEVFEQNYHKALDHRSYAFKVQDKKLLHTKSILLALRETEEGFTHIYAVPSEDTKLWYVLKEIITDLVEDEEVKIMSAWWEEWFCNFLGMDVAAPWFGSPRKEAHADKKPKRGKDTSGRTKIIYTNQTMATMLRLHQMLHGRMIEARKMANDDMNETGPSRENQLLEPETPRDDDGVPVSPRLDPNARRPGGDPFQAFISILLAMLRGNVDVTKFEDECRALLGTSSYKLFTLDKLIPRLIKETNNLVTSENWQKIKAAYDRSNSTDTNALSAIDYRKKMLEEFGHNCFQIVYDTATHKMVIMPVPVESDDEESAAKRFAMLKREEPDDSEGDEEDKETDPDGTGETADEHDEITAEDDAAQEEAGGIMEGLASHVLEATANVNAVENAAMEEDGEDESEQNKEPENRYAAAVDAMEVEEGQASQEPLIRRPTLNYGKEETDESEEESDA